MRLLSQDLSLRKLILKNIMLLIALGHFILLPFAPAFAATYFGQDSLEDKAERVKELKSLSEKEMIKYGPDKPKATVTIFTDLECGYCRKLHLEIPQLNELGIQVRYLALPRHGVGSPGYNKMVTIWCMDDPKTALNRAMDGEDLPYKTCENPVRQHFILGRKWGVSGTPTLVFSDGTVWGGYLSAERLARKAMKHEEMLNKRGS